MTNVQNISDGCLARSLVTVFAQLEQIGARRAGHFERPVPRALTQWERGEIRKQLRRDLRASLNLLKNDGDPQK